MIRFRPKLKCPFCNEMKASMRKYYHLYEIKTHTERAYQVREMHHIMCADCKADILADDHYFRTRKQANTALITLTLLGE